MFTIISFFQKLIKGAALNKSEGMENFSKINKWGGGDDYSALESKTKLHGCLPVLCGIAIKAGFHLCISGRATHAIARWQSREPVVRLRDQGPEHAY